MRDLPVSSFVLKRQPIGFRRLGKPVAIIVLLIAAGLGSIGAHFALDDLRSEQEKLAADLGMMRRIVSALVPAVQEMRVFGDTSVPSRSAELATVQVRVSRANLRAAPSSDSELLMSVAEGMTLVEHDRSGTWIRTTAPTGQDAWISAALVERVASVR